MLRLFLFLTLLIGSSTQSNARLSLDNTLPVARLTLTKPYGQFWTHWDVRGKVASTNNEIRLTPAVKGVAGAIWSKTALGMGGFGVEAELRFASKDGMHADGAAIWFVDGPSNGTAYGISSNFTGIGVVLDTFQNLDYGSKSFIGIVGSDGSTPHSMDHNGREVMLGKCNVPNIVKVDKNRRKFGETISVYVEYLGNIMRVFYKYPDSDEWNFCTDSKMHIPLAYIMGLSASTGELSARHELIALRVFEIPVNDSVAVTRSTDKLSFQKTIDQETRNNNDMAMAMWIIILTVVAILIILATILALDFYYSGEDRIFTC